MKRFIGLALAALAISALPVHAGELKLGVVGLQKIMEKSPQAEAAKKRIEGEFRPRERDLSEKRKALRDIETRLEKDGAIMSESERQKLEREAVAQGRDLKRQEQDFQEDLNRRQNEELGRMQRRLLDVVRAYGKEAGYDVIVGDGLLYFSERVDITDAILQRMIAAEKEPAPAKSGAPKGAN